MAIVFDKINKIITIEAPDTEVTIQELINAIRDYEDELENLEVESIAKASGKEDLGGGIKVGITLELINNWRVKFEDRESGDVISCKVSGGNLVATNDYNNNPICPSTNTQVTITQSSSATIVATGSALTTEEHDQLMATALQTTLLSAVDTINDNNTRIKTIEQINSGCWKMENNQLIIYKDDNTTELFRFNLYDKDGKPSMTQVTHKSRVL
jgi:hypothetical protein